MSQPPERIDIDHRSTDAPVCPYCGYAERDAWEWQGEDGETDCGACEKPYYWSRFTRVTYSTSIPKEKPDGQES